jgi:hypothetical protein
VQDELLYQGRALEDVPVFTEGTSRESIEPPVPTVKACGVWKGFSEGCVVRKADAESGLELEQAYLFGEFFRMPEVVSVEKRNKFPG